MKARLFFCAYIFASLGVSVNTNADAITVTRDNLNLTFSSITNNFGVGGPAIVDDDFDAGKLGQPLTGWTLSGQTLPVYSDAYAVTGTQSGMSSFIGHGNYNSSAEYKSLGGLNKVYLSYYVLIDNLQGINSRNVKLARFSGGHGNTYIEGAGITLFDIYNNGAFLQASIDNADSKVPTTWFNGFSDKKWHRIQYYVELSNPAGASNGTTIVTIDGKEVFNRSNLVNEETGMTYEWLTMPFYVAHDAGGDYKIYFDNVMVATNRARVEICNSKSYSSCTQPVVAKTVRWSENTITAQLPSSNRSQTYAYIFNANNVLLNSDGLQVCPTCPKPPIPE